MQAIILAAGQGRRLAEFNPDGRPKCLLEFNGVSLLSRLLDNLYKLGIHQATIVVGFEADLIIEHVGTLSSRPEVAYVYNPAYSNGSVLSLLAAQEVLRSGESLLILGSGVFSHPDLLKILVESVHQNCTLQDRSGTEVDYFKLSAAIAEELADTCAAYNADGLLDASHEEAIRDVMENHSDQFASEDISGIPWLAVDTPGDIERAIKEFQAKV